MSGGEVFVRDEGIPYNTTPRGEGFVRDEGIPYNTTPRGEGLLQYKARGEVFAYAGISGYYRVGSAQVTTDEGA
jgi:outer membrane protease